MKIILLFLLPALLTETVAPTNEWTVRPEGVEIKWELPKDGESGTMNDLEATIKFNPDNPAASSFEAKVKPESINSGNKMRDKHLKSKDYFNVEEYPEIIFRSNTVSKTDEGFNVNGKLQIKETTAEVNIPFTFKTTEDGAVFSGKLDINTTEVGIDGVKSAKGGEVNCHVEIVVPVSQ